MKKTLAFLSALVTLSCCLAGCGGGGEYNREKFYGVVRFSEESNGLVVYIPNLGDVVIPEDGAEFLKYFHEMTVEREWTD